MNAAAVLRSVGAIDVRSIGRDPLLRWLVLLTPAIAVLLRYSLPVIAPAVSRRFALDLLAFSPLIASFLPLTAAGLTGTVVGFLLLDQRDDGTLPALLVTPLSLQSYLSYRLSALLVASTGLGALMVPLAGIGESTLHQIALCTLTAAPLAPIYALFLASFAANKVQGFALVKALGMIGIPCIVAYFLRGPWSYAFAILPHYWSLKVFWLFDEGQAEVAVWTAVAGIAWQALLLLALVRRFSRLVRC
jgi:fluoroquinolone transport system permease protein